MNCPHCGTELTYEDATFCPKCGESLVSEAEETQQEVLETQQKQADLLLGAVILTMISATFVASLGYLGVYQYFAFIEYYDFSLVLGFLIFGFAGIIAAAFALAGAYVMLKRKCFRFSMLGTIFPLISVFITLLCVQHYNYGFTDILVFAEVAVIMFTAMSILMNFTSRKEYV